MQDITHQLIKYENELPFKVVNIYNKDRIDDPNETQVHWHEEMEIVYNVYGNTLHYIDGNFHKAGEGDLILVNSESIHKVIPERHLLKNDKHIAVVLIISSKFLEDLVPNYKNLYFVNNGKLNMEKISRIMLQLMIFKEEKTLQENYHLAMSLIYQLFHWLSRGALVSKELIFLENSYNKNIKTFKEVLRYIRDNYKSKLTQQDVAKKFYFTKEYFSKIFKKNTGLTFKEYIIEYRVIRGHKELIETGKTITEIALDNGFSDSRGFINSFKKIYGVTPLKYRTENEKVKKV